METPDIDMPLRRYFIADTETTGLPPCEACQIGLIEIDPLTLEPLWEIESLIDPGIPIGEVASGIHGITDAMVAAEPTMAQFVEHRLGGPLKGSLTMICHNAKFDLPMLQPLGGIDRSICTLNEARAAIRGPANFKLATLAEYFGFAPDTAHQALADCHTTRLLLKEIVRITGRSLDYLATPRARDVHVVPWGRHAGKLLAEVPRGYLEWLLTLKDLEPNLRNSVQKVLVL